MTREEEKAMVAAHFADPEIQKLEYIRAHLALMRANAWARSPAGTPYPTFVSPEEVRGGNTESLGDALEGSEAKLNLAPLDVRDVGGTDVRGAGEIDLTPPTLET